MNKMSSQIHSEILRDVAREYLEEEYNLEAMDEGYPGIFEESVPDHELKGRADLVFSYPNNSERLKIVETSSIGSLNPEIIEERYIANADQVQKHIDYFEDLGYEVEPEVELRPREQLGALKRIWEETSGVFTWNRAREVIDNDDILSQFRNDDVIILDSISRTNSELYAVNQEKKEYEELIDLFCQQVI